MTKTEKANQILLLIYTDTKGEIYELIQEIDNQWKGGVFKDDYHDLLINLEDQGYIKIKEKSIKKNYAAVFKNIGLTEKGIEKCKELMEEKRITKEEKANQILLWIYDKIGDDEYDEIPVLSQSSYPNLGIGHTEFFDLLEKLKEKGLIEMEDNNPERHQPKEFYNVKFTSNGRSKSNSLKRDNEKYFHIFLNETHTIKNLIHKDFKNSLRSLTTRGNYKADGENISIFKIQILKSKEKQEGIIKEENVEDVTEFYNTNIGFSIVPDGMYFNSMNNKMIDFDFDYAIITALQKDEMAFIEPYLNQEGSIDDDEKLIRHGTLKTDSSIKIVYASLLTTGMIDAAIVATDIISQFNPRCLIMPGVCGGRDKDDIKFGDIVVANKAYTFQKGKLTDSEFQPEWEGVDLNGKEIQLIETKENKLKESINFNGDIHYAPMACSTAVIDKENVLESIALKKDRKTVGLEMESYGIARACKITNNGNTKCLIIKGVMDKTIDKDDKYKKEAAKNSADFVMKLIEMNVLELD